MNTTCAFEIRNSQHTLCVRTRAAVQELPRIFGEAFAAIMQYLGEEGEQPAGMPFAAYHNMDMQDLDLEIGFPVTKQLPGTDRIRAGELPGGEWATLMNVGPYDQVGPAWERLASVIAQHGKSIVGPAYEFYFSEPGTPPEQIHTLLAFPIS